MYFFLYSARTHDCKLGCNCKSSRTIGVHMYTHREMIIIYFLYNWHFTYSFWFAFYYTSELLWKEKKNREINCSQLYAGWAMSNEQWASTRVSGIHCKLIVTLFRQARILFVLHTCPLSVVSFVPSILFDFLEHLICSCVLLSSFPFPLHIYSILWWYYRCLSVHFWFLCVIHNSPKKIETRVNCPKT